MSITAMQSILEVILLAKEVLVSISKPLESILNKHVIFVSTQTKRSPTFNLKNLNTTVSKLCDLKNILVWILILVLVSPNK